MRLFVLPFLTLTLALPALAGDGRLEINQICAVSTGCFAGDGPGFPVQVTSAGSYLLTSNLDLRGIQPSRAIDVSAVALATTVDLNGFEIIGGAPDCTGSGATLSCSPDLGADGIAALSPWHITVRNGTVRNMQGAGVVVGPMGRVEDVSALYNSSDGISAGQQSLVGDCIAFRNAGDGLDVANASVVSDSVSSGNGQFGIDIGPDSTVHGSLSRANGDLGFNRTGRLSQTANACDDGSCSRRGERSFYLTTTPHQGAGALTACDAGFHMASLWEIHDTTQLRYDATRGPRVGYDLGQGPPGQDAFGWARTGHISSDIPAAGNGNCNLWATSDPSASGTIVGLSAVWNLSALGVDPWNAGAVSCNSPNAVWCVED